MIAIEGLDGSGKTTIAKSLSFEKRVPYVKFPSSRFLGPHTSTLAKVGSTERLLLFVAGVLDLVSEGDAEGLFIADRYMGSAVGMHATCDSELLKALYILPCPDPDLVIYLDIPEVERQRRLASRPRGRDAFEIALDLDESFRRLVRQTTLDYYRSRDVPVGLVMTSTESPVETLSRVMELVRKA